MNPQRRFLSTSLAGCLSLLVCDGGPAIAQRPFINRGTVVPLVNETFEDAPLRVAVGTIAERTGVQYRIVGDADLPVTGRCTGASAVMAFRELDEIAGVLSVFRGRTVTVYSADAEDALEGRPLTYLHRFQYADASEVMGDDSETASVLGLDELPDVQLVKSLNACLIRAPIEDVRQAVRLLQVVDRPHRNVIIELLIVQYFHGDRYQWQFDIRNGTLIKNYRSDNLDEDDDVSGDGLDETDTIPSAEEFPFDESDDSLEPEPGKWGFDATSRNLLSSSGISDLAYTGVGVLSSQFKLNLTSLVDDNRARIVTNPRVVTMAGHAGQFKLTEEVNFLAGVDTTVGLSETQDYVGTETYLTVKPTVASSSRIHMRVEGQVEVFVPTTAAEFDTGLPDQRKSLVVTEASLKADQTLIIGGLIKEVSRDGETGFPILKDAPLIGRLFRGQTRNRAYIETVIYLTPRLRSRRREAAHEDRYFDEITSQMQQLQDRGEQVDFLREMDDLKRRQLRQLNRQLDKDVHKEQRHIQLRHWLDKSSDTPGEVFVPEMLPGPAASQDVDAVFGAPQPAPAIVPPLPGPQARTVTPTQWRRTAVPTRYLTRQ